MAPRGRPGGGLDVVLPRDATSAQAIGVLLAHLLDVIVATVPGAVSGGDPEAVHDLRVAVRRTRSLLVTTRHLAPDRPRRALAQQLRWVVEVTSPVRDLEVLLREVSALPGLGTIEDLLVGDLVAARSTMAGALTSERFDRLIADGRTLADHLRADATTSSSARRHARRHIWKAYRRVRRHGAAVGDAAPASQLHQLRKDAKRLRYLLELFGGLLDGDRVAAVVADLRGLQDVLGEVQDTQVQAEALHALAGRVGDPEVRAAVEALVDDRARAHRAARAVFRDRFHRFDRRASRRRVADLCGR